MAVAISIAAAIVTILYSAFHPTLPFARTSDLIIIYERRAQGDFENEVPVSVPQFRDWKAGSRAFADLAALTSPLSINLRTGDSSERIKGVQISANTLRLLGIEPLRGSWVTADVSTASYEPVAAISYRFWVRHFASSNVLGNSILLNNQLYRIVAVMGSDFQLPVVTDQADVILPLDFNSPAAKDRYARTVIVVGRLAKNTSPAAAVAEIASFSRSGPEGQQRDHDGYIPSLVRIRDQFSRDASRKEPMLVGVVIVVLAIGYSAFVSVFLVQTISKSYEFVVRLALGARRVDLFRRLLVQCASGMGIACIAGALLTIWTVHTVDVFRPVYLPGVIHLGFGAPAVALIVLLWILGSLLAAVLGFSLVPSSQLQAFLQLGKTRVASAHRLIRHTKSSIVCTEIALTLVLLTALGTTVRSFVRLIKVDLGFNAARLTSARVTLDASKYGDSETQTLFFRSVLEQLRYTHDIKAATITNSTPFGDWGTGNGFHGEGSTLRPSDVPMAGTNVVDPDYFRTLGAQVVVGRPFASYEPTPVAVVNRTLAERTWPGENPIGKKLVILPPEMNLEEGAVRGGVRSVIGVVNNMKWALDEQPWPEIYIPFDQNVLPAMEFVVQCDNADQCMKTLREVVTKTDPSLPLYSVFSLESRISESLAPQRFQLLTMTTFGTVGLLLSSLGVYSLLSFTVISSTNEIGVRMALGAMPKDIIRLVFRKAAILVAVGLSGGIVASLGFSRILSSVLFGAQAADWVTVGVALTTLAGFSLLAAYIPSVRAGKIAPAVALRSE